jgi:hypothetical protein
VTRRDTLRDLALISLACLVVRSLVALLVEEPGYMDAYYYFHVARNLASGQGLVEQVLWNYLDNPAGLPHPSNLYWMPLTAMLVAPGLALFGDGFRAAQVPLVLISPLVPLIAYFTARLLLAEPGLAKAGIAVAGGQATSVATGTLPGDSNSDPAAVGVDSLGRKLVRQQLLAVALLTIFSGVYFVYWAMPDSFASFAIPGALSLLCMGLGMERCPRWFLAAGVCAALAHLSRPDGILLLAVLLAAVLARFWPRQTEGNARLKGGGVVRVAGWCSAVVAVYLLVLAPWLARNVAVSGFISPGATEALFQREYNDLFRYGRTLTPAYYLDWGWQNILGSKVQAAGENLLVFAEPFLFYTLPFGLLGFWRWRRRPAAWPFLAYCALLYAVMTLLFTFAGPRGSYLHSMAALLPFYSVAIVKGIELTIHWLAGRLKHWVEPRAQRHFLAIVVTIAAVMSVVLAIRAAGGWRERFALYSAAAGWFSANGASSATVMVIDPPGWYYVSGQQAIMTPNEPLAIMLQVCRRYGASYLLLEGAHPMGLNQLYVGLESSPSLAPRGIVSGIQIYEIVDIAGASGAP